MHVSFRCKDCGQGYRAPARMGGARLDCRRCGWPLWVPRPMPGGPAVAAVAETEWAAPAAAAARSREPMPN